MKNKQLKWQSSPPGSRGYWWVLDTKSNASSLVEVEPVKHGRKLEWSFIDGLTWNPINKYRDYLWAGPIVPPEFIPFKPKPKPKPYDL